MNTTSTTNEISHPHLAAAAAAAARFCPGGRCNRPVLQNVLVRRDDDGTTVAATDLSQSILVRFSDGGGRGVALVPAKAAKSLGDSVRFSGETVSAGGITAPMDDPLEYPHQSLCQLRPVARLRLADVEAILKAVAPAVDDESSRYSLGGIRLEIDGDALVAIATDGRRLHALRAPNETSCGEAIDAVVYPGVLSGIVKAVKAIAKDAFGRKAKRLEDDAIEIRRSASDFLIEARWECGDVLVAVQGREVEGKFPKWKDCFPRECFQSGGRLTLNIEDAVKQLKEAKRAATEVHKGVLFEGGSIKSGHESIGLFHAELAGEQDCPPVRLDSGFVIEALSAVTAIGGGESAAFAVKGSQSAVFLRSHGANGLELHVVIMPLAAD